MKVLMVNAGNESGGGRTHIINLMKSLMNRDDVEPLLLVMEDGPVSDMARKNHIPVKILPQNGKLNFGYLNTLKKYINDNNYDIVHSHGARSNLFLSLIKNQITSKWVTTVHSDPKIDFDLNTIKGKILYKLNVTALKKADLLFLISDRFKATLKEEGIDEDKMVPIFNAIDFQDKLADHKSKTKEIHIIMVARMVAVKNHKLALESLSEVQFPFVLHLVGDGEEEDNLREFVKDHKMEDSVIFEGFQDNVDPYYKNADVMLLTSDSEGFPFVFLEAAQYGIPAISTDVGGVHQIIKSDEMGWIVPVGDKSRLKSALDDSYQKYRTDELEVMGKKFYAYVKDNLTLESLADVVVESYKKIL